MSMSFSYVAVTADSKSVEEALFALCPEFYIMELQPELGTFVQMYGYCQSRSGYLNGLHPNDVKAFCQHQGWCIIIDFSLILPESNHVLSALSSQFGTVVTAMTQGASGSAYFALFQNGELKRKISSNNGVISTAGEPLADEAGIDGNVFYITQLDSLWQAQGLPPYLARLGGPYSAVHYLDNTEASVEKDIEEIAEKTRQYEELEALKARQRKTGEFVSPGPHGQSNVVPQLGVIQRMAAAEQPNVAPQPTPTEQANAAPQPPPAEQPNVAPQPTPAEQPNAAAQSPPTEPPRINSLLSTSDDIEAITHSQRDTQTDNQAVVVSESATLNAPSTSDDSEDDEKAEKPKDKPWWKLW